MDELGKSRDIIQQIINSIIGKRSNLEKNLETSELNSQSTCPFKNRGYCYYSLNRTSTSKLIMPLIDFFGNQYLLEI